MIEMELDVDLSVGGPLKSAGQPVTLIDVGPLDDLYYRYVTVDGTEPATGVIKLRTQRSVSEEPLNGGDLTLDGTANTIAIDGAKYIDFYITTPESGRSGRLYIFARRDRE